MNEPTPAEFALIADYIYKTCGIVITEDKKYLIMQRLGPLAKEAGCKSFGEYYKIMKAAENNEAARIKIVESITTNETSFFRDEHPYLTFKTHILPTLLDLFRKNRFSESPLKRKIRIWSSASSTGQEPYTIAMMVREYLKSNNIHDTSPFDFRILGTDISTAVLVKAVSGVYNEIEIGRGLPEKYKSKYFRQDGDNWIISNEIREMVEFKQVNLVKPFFGLGTFEFILCRNVLIYFDERTKKKILDQFYDMLAPGGFLMLGAMENTYCLSDRFMPSTVGKTIFYRKN